MRDLKFRAWDGESMIYPDHRLLGGIRSWDILQRFDNPMQYTGLKDKQGNEVYEGDILTGFIGNFLGKPIDIPRCYVVWDNASFCLLDREGCFRSTAEYHKLREMEVIGNIYANSGLIKGGDNGN